MRYDYSQDRANELLEEADKATDKLVRFLINEALVEVDDMSSSEAADEAVKVIASLTARLSAVERLAQEFVNNIPESEMELARDVWGNTNTRIALESRKALAAALGDRGTG